ncbi:hypothetical protein [Methylomonas sp. AM2-LC]|uniref:hypothetical protein n=1 Tax=Methylomonas sp. AM2-LC TaxID=3153301 RepID=UPI0032649F11
MKMPKSTKKLYYCLFSIISIFIYSANIVKASETHSVYLPLIFNSEVNTYKTSACLKVVEVAYPDGNRWWEQGSSITVNSPEDAFRNVISAILKKDKAELFKWSHSTLGHDTQEFDSQAAAYFAQFEKLQLVSASRSYRFDGLALVYVTAKLADGRLFSFPLSFAEDNKVYKFLPYRSEIVSYRLVTEWLSVNTSGQADGFSYCDDKTIKNATYKVQLVPPTETSKTDPISELFLHGASINLKNPQKGLEKDVVDLLARMKKADFAKPKELNGFLGNMTLEGANRLKEWLNTASIADKERYKNELFNVTPIFIFDASPLIVTYVKWGARVQTMYFTYNEKHKLVWTNSSHISLIDKVFKNGVLFDDAQLDKPFENYKIQ